jgi:pyruvoyl-dependent arginine decarboxylase (PvlArgDC)
VQPGPRLEHLPAEVPDFVARPRRQAPRAGTGHLCRHVRGRHARTASADRRELYGYLSEHHSFGESEDIAADYAEELAAEMLATTLGLDFDPDKSWDEKKEIYRLSNQIVRTQNVTQTAIGDKKGLWTTVVAAAVLVG